MIKGPMLRGILNSTLIVAQMQPLAAAGERSLLEYAVTQGGLLAFALVLLYFYRRDNQRIQAKDAEKASILTDLIGDLKELMGETKQAMTKSSEAISRQADAIRDLTSVVSQTSGGRRGRTLDDHR